jgi:hypothetical protein
MLPASGRNAGSRSYRNVSTNVPDRKFIAVSSSHLTWRQLLLLFSLTFVYWTRLIVLSPLPYFFSLYLCVLIVLHDTDFLVKDFVCIHVHPKACISLSLYFIPLLIAVCEIFPAIQMAPHHDSYFFLCPSHSFFYLSIFWYILVLVALSVSGCSACSCLATVTFLSPSIRLPVTPDCSL